MRVRRSWSRSCSWRLRCSNEDKIYGCAGCQTQPGFVGGAAEFFLIGALVLPWRTLRLSATNSSRYNAICSCARRTHHHPRHRSWHHHHGLRRHPRVVPQQGRTLEMGALHLSKVKDPAKLKRIHERCAGLIEAHTPDHFAVEAPSSARTSNRCSSLAARKVWRSRRPLSARCRSPSTPRAGQAGHHRIGRASKDRWPDVQRTLNIPDADMLRDLDATDGLAVALCAPSRGHPDLGGKGGGWAASSAKPRLHALISWRRRRASGAFGSGRQSRDRPR